MSNHITQSLDEFKDDILEDGIIDAEEVAKLRERLYDDGVIDEEEADFLFALNDATTGKSGHDAGWPNLFVEAITDFVLQDEETPGVVDDGEAAYLMEKIGADGQVDANELALLVNISAKAVEECPGNFNSYILNAIKNAVIADGVVDEDEVAMLKAVVYGAGGAGGADVDRMEADLLFEINDATEDNEGHHSSWGEFFVEAIGKHVLEDEVSPGVIDEDEGGWLLSKITAKGGDDFGPLELELLAHIKSNATSIHGPLKDKI